MLVAHPRGNYHFLPGIDPYSSGVAADAGYEVVRVTLRAPLPYREGFARIEAILKEAGRERNALCGVELRSPAPFTRSGFAGFNVEYRGLIEQWGLLVDGQNPVARTNVAPLRHAPAEPSLYAFSYTAPAPDGVGQTFVVAGAGELRGGSLAEAAVVRAGDTSAEGMREKASYVMAVMSRRLAGLGAGWERVTATSVYTVETLETIVVPTILEGMGSASLHGVRWYHARPPIAELDFEMDARGVRREEVR